MKASLSIILALVFTAKVFSQDLPRRVFLGIRMENLNSDKRRIMGLGDEKGVLVSEVLPASTALDAGFKKGDVLSSINGISFNSTNEVFDVLADQKGGEAFRYEIYRDKKLIKGNAVFRSYPEEKYPDLKVEYKSFNSQLGPQRTIVTKPLVLAKLPVIAFIGGIGCYSLDFAMDSTRSEIQLINMLARSGYLVARLEKPGVGDNTNTTKACNEVSFMEETAGYVDAINALKQRSDVDSNSVYIIGHSMGGVFGPLVAQKTKVKGIIAYGTLGSNFIEYLAKTRRTIAEAYNMPPDETDDLIKTSCECSSYYFIEKMTTDEATRKNSRCREHVSIFDLRSRAYNDELYSFNVPGLWKYFDGKALLIWGESDYISAKEDHMIIEKTVNYFHAGNGEFVSVKDADHGMAKAGSFYEARTNPGSYNNNVGKTMLNWLKKQTRA